MQLHVRVYTSPYLHQQNIMVFNVCPNILGFKFALIQLNSFFLNHSILDVVGVQQIFVS